MSCSRQDADLAAYLDDELPQDRRRAFEEHLAMCERCRGELEQARHLHAELDALSFRQPGEEELNRYWCNVYNRLERGMGWALLSLGAIVLIAWGSLWLIRDFLGDSRVAFAAKVGVVALLLGFVVLFVSLLRERMCVWKTDRYSRETRR